MGGEGYMEMSGRRGRSRMVFAGLGLAVACTLGACRCGGAVVPMPPESMRCQTALDQDCFVEVKGTTFVMGAQADDPSGAAYDPEALDDEGPPHQVTLQTFWISRDEFGVSAYRRCLSDGACLETDTTSGGYSNRGSGRLGHPINAVSWDGARRACAWLGGRLPTEAEWELAARGSDGRRWPWGNEPACGRVPQGDGRIPDGADLGDDMTMLKPPCDHDGTIARRDIRGRSPYSVAGMAGSVWEWVEDGYGPYDSQAVTDPRGPSAPDKRVIRGGGWTAEDALELRAAGRAAMLPSMQVSDVGFRCVWGTREGAAGD